MNEIQITKSKFKDFMNKLQDGIGNDLVNELVRTCPVDKGTLRSSIHYDKGTIYMLDYALHVEYGTPPHIIRPKNAKALHFKKDGKDIFTQKVNHPGTRPQPFIRTALGSALKDIVANNIRRLNK